MTYVIPNVIQNGDDIDAVPVQANFASITNEINNIETAQVADEANITALKSTVEVGGWVSGPALTYVSADGPTQVTTASTDLTNKLYPGVRLKYQQTQAIQNYWSFDTNSADSKGSATMANIGTPTYTAGKFGNALTLNGTDQALSITDAAAFKPTDNFTIGCWFKTSATGAARVLFQSYSANTNHNGIKLIQGGGNVLSYSVGTNSATEAVTLTGTTTITDGNMHYVVVSVRNNFTQIYLDGKLEVSGYTPTPTYAATNYVRIGCYNTSGTNSSYFSGQIDDLFIASYALDEQTIAAKYAASTAQGTGDITLTKYALVTASSYSAPNTTVTIYSGTDHTMMNSTISNAYYSTQDVPYGFPKDKLDKLGTIYRQDNSTNTSITEPLIQTGWGWIQGSGSATNGAKTVTFPVKFDSLPTVMVTHTNSKDTTDPTDIGQFTVTTSNVIASVRGISTTSASLLVDSGSGGANLLATRRYGYSWIAIGTRTT